MTDQVLVVDAELVCTIVCALILGISGLSHLSGNDLRAAVTAHQVLPPAIGRVVVRTLPAAEIALGVALCVVQALQVSPVTTVLVRGATALLFGSFVVYSLGALRGASSGAVDCGCGLGEGTLGPVQIARAAVLMVMGLYLAFVPPDETGGIVISTLVAGTTVALLLALPSTFEGSRFVRSAEP